MAVFTVDTDAVITNAGTTQLTADRIQAESHTLLAQLTGLQSLWTGQAATAFHAVVEEWRVTQTMVEQSLASISRALAAAGSHYADAELANTSMFR